MQTMLLAVVLVVLTMAALAVGLFLGRPPIKGSCGGIACEGACGACERHKGTSA